MRLQFHKVDAEGELARYEVVVDGQSLGFVTKVDSGFYGQPDRNGGRPWVPLRAWVNHLHDERPSVSDQQEDRRRDAVQSLIQRAACLRPVSGCDNADATPHHSEPGGAASQTNPTPQ